MLWKLKMNAEKIADKIEKSRSLVEGNVITQLKEIFRSKQNHEVGFYSWFWQEVI
jgi:hypothetical protein